MVIVAHLGNTVNEYETLFAAKFPHLSRACPGCQKGRLWRHGCFERWVVGPGISRRLPIQRFRCPHCRITVSLLPDFVSPYSSYLLCVRAQAVADRLDQGLTYSQIALRQGQNQSGLCPETVRQWVHQTRGLLALLEPFLVRELGRLQPDHPRLGLEGGWRTAGETPWTRFLGWVSALRQAVGELLGCTSLPGSSTLGFLNAYLRQQSQQVWI